MNRIERISAILIQLQSKKVVKGQEIADRFGISLRTAYRDIRALEISGVPITSEAGIGYSLVDGYRLPPISFTQEEARAFLTAEKLVDKFTDTRTTKDYQSALYKIKSVLKAADKEHLEDLDATIQVVKHFDIPSSENSLDHLPNVLKSIASKKVLNLSYFANHNQEITERTVEPIGVFMMGNHWYLIAYCLLRKDYRNFRVDRIKESSILNEAISKKHPSLKNYLKEYTKSREGIFAIKIHVENSSLKYFGEQKYYHGLLSEKKHKTFTEMSFLSASLEGFARWFVVFGDSAAIIEPNELKERVKSLAAEILKKLNS